MSGDKAVVKLLYRCMLRCSRQIDALPLDLRASHIDEVLPGLRRELGDKSGSVRSLAQIGFRQQAFGHSCGVRTLATPAMIYGSPQHQCQAVITCTRHAGQAVD